MQSEVNTPVRGSHLVRGISRKSPLADTSNPRDLSDAFQANVEPSPVELATSSSGNGTGPEYEINLEEEAEESLEGVLAATQKLLERGRKSVWEMAARRVAALLSADVIISNSANQFLEVRERM